MAGDVPEQFRMMTVHAHPDDESSKGAATCARYAAEGHEVMVVTCTGGERGSILNPAMETPENLANMPALRLAEMARAAEILGVQHRWLGFVDSGLPEGDPKPPLPDGCFAVVDIEESAEALVRLIREFRPHVFVTYDENGGYPHPDHIRTHEVSMVAFDAAGDPDRFPDAGDPWQPLKLYYSHGFSRERFMKIHQAMLDRTGESPYAEWIERWAKADAENKAKAEAEGKEHNHPDPDSRVTTRVACGDYFELRDAALKAHATQVDPSGWWFRVPLDLQREIWPTEEYELVRSLVDSTTPEDSLFAGVQERVSA